MTTKVRPVSAGSDSKKACSAFKPPADAPIPTTLSGVGSSVVSCGPEFCSSDVDWLVPVVMQFHVLAFCSLSGGDVTQFNHRTVQMIIYLRRTSKSHTALVGRQRICLESAFRSSPCAERSGTCHIRQAYSHPERQANTVGIPVVSARASVYYM